MQKQPTAKQLEARKKFADAARARAAEAKQKKLDNQNTAPVQHPEPQEEPRMESNQDIGDLLKQIAELKDNPLIQALFAPQGQAQPQQSGSQMTSRGLIGVHTKYITDPSHYPNPIERLAQETRLQRFAFNDNYELAFKIETANYETKDGRTMEEPKFTLELHRVVYDEETGEKTNGRYTVCRAVFFEDPAAAIVVARENGLNVDETNEKQFLDEMRYIRMRNWLLEAFYPPQNTGPKSSKKDMVIGGKLVEYFEVNGESAQAIPFGQLKSKVKG